MLGRVQVCIFLDSSNPCLVSTASWPDSSFEKKGGCIFSRSSSALCERDFAKIVGTPVAEDTPAKKGPNNVTPENAKRAWEYWQPKGRLTDTADY